MHAARIFTYIICTVNSWLDIYIWKKKMHAVGDTFKSAQLELCCAPGVFCYFSWSLNKCLGSYSWKCILLEILSKSTVLELS